MERLGSTANKRLFALIGGIASGKTVVSNAFGELGAHIIDADIVSREVTARGTAGEAALLAAFPDCVTNGEVSRRMLKNKVFSDSAALTKLNDITHPLIMDEIFRQVSVLSDVIIVVMPVPLMLDSFDEVLSVYAPMDERIARLVERDNIDMELAKRIIGSQMSDECVEAVSDYTFYNVGSEADLVRAVRKWWNIYVEN